MSRAEEIEAALKELFDEEYELEVDGHVPLALKYKIRELQEELSKLREK